MTPSFQALGSATACPSVRNHRTEPVTDARKHDDIGREHGPAQQGGLLLEALALVGAPGGSARAQTTLDEGEQRNVSQRRHDRADDGSDEPGKRQIYHAVAPSFREESPVLQDAGDDRDQPKRMSWS